MVKNIKDEVLYILEAVMDFNAVLHQCNVFASSRKSSCRNNRPLIQFSYNETP